MDEDDTKFRPKRVKAVGHGSETQLPVGENLYIIINIEVKG